MRRKPGEHERDAVARSHVEGGDRAHVLTLQRDRRSDDHRIATSDGEDATFDVAHPGDDRSVVESQPQVGVHPHRPRPPLDHPDHRRATRADRHEVDHRHHPVGRGELGLEHHGVTPVPAPHRDRLAPCCRLGRHQPAAMVLVAEQGREHRRLVEGGQAQPVDRAVQPDQGGGLGVTDEGVLLDGQGHRNSMTSKRLVAAGYRGAVAPRTRSPCP